MKNALIACVLMLGIGFGGLGCSPGGKTNPGSEAPLEQKNGTIELINSAGLDGFIPNFREESPTKDPAEAFQFTDGMLHITGQGWGYLRTRETFENYRLVVEYRWGEFTADIRENRARDSGIFVHASGNDRAFRNAWLSSFEAQMIEGRAGDLILIAAVDPATGQKDPYQLTSKALEVKVPEADSDYEHDPNAAAIVLPTSPRIQRVRIFRDPRDDGWKDEKGYLGPNPIEKPAGEWNRMVIVCEGDSLEVILNDQTVNVARNVSPANGHICIQSELSECWIRTLKLHPIEKKE